MTAVYPKQDPEYRKRIMDQFYRQVKDTKWEDDWESKGKPRGRKPKITERIPAKLRPSEKYNWFNK